MRFDEYGRPINDDPLSMLEQHTQPEPYRVDPQKFLQEAYGIGTTGPQADQAAQNAQNYAPPLYDEGGQVRHMPQQYGQAGDVYSPDEGPLTPQQTAEAMPTTTGAMDKLIKQHLLPMHPSLKRLSPDGYQSHLAAKREQEAAEKQQRMQQGYMNRAASREKDQDAYDQTLRLNAVQGAGPLAGGGGGDSTSFGSGGPGVQRIGGFSFVSGRWRPQTPEEQAQTGLMQARAKRESAQPMLEAMDISSRGQIAKMNNEARAATEAGRYKENEANRGIQSSRLDETKRHNTVLEANAAADDAARLASQAEKELDAARSELDDLTAQLREREGIADEQSRGYLWNSNREPYLDDRRDSKDSKKFVREKGSFASRAQRAAMLLTKLEDALKAKKYKGYIPDDQYEYLDSLRKKYPATRQF